MLPCIRLDHPNVAEFKEALPECKAWFFSGKGGTVVNALAPEKATAFAHVQLCPCRFITKGGHDVFKRAHPSADVEALSRVRGATLVPVATAAAMARSFGHAPASAGKAVGCPPCVREVARCAARREHEVAKPF